MSYATNKKSFSFGLTDINELCKFIDCILDDIFVFFYQSDLRIEAFDRVWKYDMLRIFPGYGKYLGYGKYPGYGNFLLYGNFPGYGRPGIKMCRNSCRNPGYGNFQDRKIFQDMQIF